MEFGIQLKRIIKNQRNCYLGKANYPSPYTDIIPSEFLGVMFHFYSDLPHFFKAFWDLGLEVDKMHRDRSLTSSNTNVWSVVILRFSASQGYFYINHYVVYEFRMCDTYRSMWFSIGHGVYVFLSYGALTQMGRCEEGEVV